MVDLVLKYMERGVEGWGLGDDSFLGVAWELISYLPKMTRSEVAGYVRQLRRLKWDDVEVRNQYLRKFIKHTTPSN